LLLSQAGARRLSLSGTKFPELEVKWGPLFCRCGIISGFWFRPRSFAYGPGRELRSRRRGGRDATLGRQFVGGKRHCPGRPFVGYRSFPRRSLAICGPGAVLGPVGSRAGILAGPLRNSIPWLPAPLTPKNQSVRKERGASHSRLADVVYSSSRSFPTGRV